MLPPGPLTEVITFNEPIQPSSVSDSDISLFGEVRGIDYTPSSISFDPTDTILTINYSSLPTDAYQFTLVAGPEQLPEHGGRAASEQLRDQLHDARRAPAPSADMQPVLPLGSLVYQTTIDNLLLSSSDVDTYDLSIDPHQTLAVVVTPVTSAMTVTVTLISPTGNVLGSATSSEPRRSRHLAGRPELQGGHLPDRGLRRAGRIHGRAHAQCL